jgi:hypothetical protein
MVNANIAMSIDLDIIKKSNFLNICEGDTKDDASLRHMLEFLSMPI